MRVVVVVPSKTSGLAGLLHIKSLRSPPATVTAVRQGLGWPAANLSSWRQTLLRQPGGGGLGNNLFLSLC